MIQRIQTLFLLTSVILLIIFPFTPLLKIWSNNEIYMLKGIGLINLQYHKNFKIHIMHFPYAILAITSFLSALIAFFNVFKYTNRVLQIKICKLNNILNTLILLTITFFSFKIRKSLGLDNFNIKDIQYGIILIIFSITCNLMAIYYINKDEKLVRSADRLR